MPMKGAGPEPHLYWVIEAKDLGNMTPPVQAAVTLAPATSRPHHLDQSMRMASLM